MSHVGSIYFPKTAVRMVDVAKAAGVARVTVSRVFSNNSQVATDKRVAILAAAKKLGYHPNFNARVLARGQAMLVGAVVPDLTDHRIVNSISTLSDGLMGAGFPLMIAQSHNGVEEQAKIIDTFLERRVNALILLDSAYPDGRTNRIDDQNPPIIEYWSGACDVSLLVKRLTARLQRPGNASHIRL